MDITRVIYLKPELYKYNSTLHVYNLRYIHVTRILCI